MSSKSNWVSTLVPVGAALFCSRTVLVSFADPEGPNLLVVVVLASFIYFLAWLPFRFLYSLARYTGLRRSVLMVVFQVLIVVVLYFSLL